MKSLAPRSRLPFPAGLALALSALAGCGVRNVESPAARADAAALADAGGAGADAQAFDLATVPPVDAVTEVSGAPDRAPDVAQAPDLGAADRAAADVAAVADLAAAAPDARPDAGPVDVAALLDAGADGNVPPPDAAAPDGPVADAPRDLIAAGDGADAGGPDLPGACSGHVQAGNVTVKTFVELAALQGVQCIDGNLTVEIGSDSTLTNLDPLLSLRAVTGYLLLHSTLNTARLANMDGLASLVHVGGSLAFVINASPVAVRLPALEQVGGNLELARTPSTDSITFPALVRVGQDLLLASQLVRPVLLPALREVGRDISAFSANVVELDLPALRSVGRKLDISYGQTRVLNAPLLQVISGDLSLRDTGLERVELPALVMAANVRLTGNGLLTRFWAPLLATTGYLGIGTLTSGTGNPGLVMLELPALRAVTRIDVGHNAALADLAMPVLDAGATVPIEVFQNPKLGRFALPALRTARKLVFWDNPLLAILDLGKLESVSEMTIYGAGFTASPILDRLATPGSLRIQNNPTMTSLALPAMTTVSLLELRDHPELTSFTAPLLRTVTSRIDVVTNAKLGAVSLPALTSGGHLRFAENAVLPSLSAPSLTTLDGFELRLNEGLKVLAFGALARVDEYFSITANHSLPTCRATALRDQVLARMGIGGSISIAGGDDDTPCP